MKSWNKVMIMGHLTHDPELRQTKAGKTVANFALAINRASKAEDGTIKEIADFYRIVAWSKLAETSSQYLKKGMAVFVEGRLVNNSFDDQEGNRHYRTEIIADGLNILTPRQKSL